MKRAKEGAKLTIGFIGGSITMGSVSSTPQLCYAYHVFSWWKKMFPNSEMVYVNAGIGATDSQFGCARVQSDLLDQKPDFVIVEFSVNDSSTPHYMETYEGWYGVSFVMKMNPPYFWFIMCAMTQGRMPN